MAKPATATKNHTAPATKEPVQPEVNTETEETTALTVGNTSSALTTTTFDLAADADEFQEHFDRDEIAIPFIQILQSNSPQVKPGNAKAVEGAQQGQLFNTVTKETFDGIKVGIEIVPVMFNFKYIVWRPRDSGGGFVAELDKVAGAELLLKTVKNEKKHDIIRIKDHPYDGMQLVATMEYFVIQVGEDGEPYTQAIITMTSTQLKKARNWNSRIQGVKVDTGHGKVTAPCFFNTYRLKTVTEHNNDGDWYGFSVEDGRPTLEASEALYLAAREFRRAIQGGAIQVNRNISEDNTGETPGTNEKAPF